MPKKNVTKYSKLLQDEQVKRWHSNLARGSQITAEVALRRLSKLCELLETTPKGMIEKAKNNMRGFQDALEDMVGKLELDGKAPAI